LRKTSISLFCKKNQNFLKNLLFSLIFRENIKNAVRGVIFEMTEGCLLFTVYSSVNREVLYAKVMFCENDFRR